MATLKQQRGLQQEADQVDFASRALGSRVFLRDTSPSLKAPGLLASVLPWFGSVAKPPSVVFKPHAAQGSGLSVGDCWAFPGHTGQLTVALAKDVIPTEFAVEHLDNAPGLRRSSAPKRVQVFACDEGEPEQLLAEYEYRLDGSARQSFPATRRASKPVRYLRLKILSNNGHPDYTCVYRFRVYSSVTHLDD